MTGLHCTGNKKTQEPVMAPCHQAGHHPAFPLSDATVAKEVVAVHNGQLAQEELNGALAPALLWTLPLRQAQRRDPFNHLWKDIGRYETDEHPTCSSSCLMSCSWLRRAWLPCRMYEGDTSLSLRLKFSLFIAAETNQEVRQSKHSVELLRLNYSVTHNSFKWTIIWGLLKIC